MAQADTREGSSALAEIQGLSLEELGGKIVVLGKDRGNPRSVHITKLSIDQWLAIAHLAFDIAATISDKERGVLAAVAGSKETNWATMLPLILNKKSLLGLLSILGGVEEEWLDAHFSMGETVELLEAVDEQEDLRRIIVPFQRIAARWQTSPGSGPRQ